MQSLEDLILKATDGKGIDEIQINDKLQTEIRDLTSNPTMVPDMSSYAKFAIKQLVHERIFGIYKDDTEGFTSEVFKLLKSDGDAKKPATQTSTNAILNLQESQIAPKSVVEELYEDRDRFRSDVREQMRRKTVKYQLLTKYTEADLIKPKANELAAFHN